MRFKCVSKYWKSRFSDPYFTKKHFRYAELGISENTYRLLHSLNPPQSLDLQALKNIKHHNDGSFANGHLGIPELLRKSCPRKGIVGSCNGLICVIVAGTTLSRGDQPNHSCFYSKIEFVECSPIPDPVRIVGRGFFLNGALHWLDQGNRHKIWCFDLVEEKFHDMIPLPDADIRFERFHGLRVVRNCLCVFSHLVRDGVRIIWLMKEYGVKPSWTEVVSGEYVQEYYQELSIEF
ncbi:uncharacterized protein LOC126787352 [Argentina anserina]|uniref:uncharacterized protein LOC126787352 n=1 Tax=Argentina anserina TaxID=57926 RepID=UPI0021767B0E|nr:uncharacterized protein LOC126787352 [Potentilla anserina]